MHPRTLRIEDYTYELPDERIARYPLPERDASKLLVYKEGDITEQPFTQLADHIERGSLLAFNETRVVNARLLFQKPSGGAIEVFCLEPHKQYADITTAMMQHGKVFWHCMVGSAAKWKGGMILERKIESPSFTLSASIVERTATDFIIELFWDNGDLSFAEVLKAAGKIPLPPYLKRDAEASDTERYQTIFAKQEGSVAAPTASLHFTPTMLDRLAVRGVDTTMLTLHVGAGTFKPVKSETIGEHAMHEEWLEVSRDTIERLISQIGKPVIAVGTTALRTLESLYWLGVKMLRDEFIVQEDLVVGQWEPYEQAVDTIPVDALNALIKRMDDNGQSAISARTQILIAPGYTFRIVEGLVTNFHQPQSTLLLLVAALIGDDWKKVYGYAMEHDFRFLSYGDSSLLWRRVAL